MQENEYWKLFLETGAPVFYLQYKATLTEDNHVPDDPGHRPACYGLQ